MIVITHEPHYSFLVKLHTEKLKREIRDLVARKKNSLAMVAALTKGRLEKKIACHEIHGTSADLMLSENNARWDLMK
ncbi:MAG: hypothetical protein WCY36_06805 [Candidatus Omnitrophota bacterium]